MIVKAQTQRDNKMVADARSLKDQIAIKLRDRNISAEYHRQLLKVYRELDALQSFH